MKLNVELLRRIQQHIREEPLRLDMGGWVVTKEECPDFTFPACGTVACIAGWAVLLSGGKPEDLAIPDRASRLIGLERYGRLEQGLYYVNNWPEPYQTLYRDASTREEKAKVAADRIEQFIQDYAEGVAVED